MSYVDDADVQIHLPLDKLRIEEIPDDRSDAVEYAERIVRGYLAGVLESATIASWVSPATTPSQIRLMTGLFAAAKIYRLRYSEDSLDDPEYAQQLYDEAMLMLQGIRDGTIIIDDTTDVTTGFDNTWFQPNDASTDEPKFHMADIY